jgi:type IX secretion system PorP/SprF family membrane protein
MKYKIAISLFLLFHSIVAFAQEMPLFNQYVINPYLLNPARAGTTIYPEIILTHRQQWIGVDDAPATQVLTFQTRTYDNIGLGFCLANDKNGLTQRRFYQGTFAYHLNFSEDALKHLLSLGISVQANESVVDESQFTQGLYDPRVNGNKETYFAPNAALGAFYMNRNFYAGIAFANLIRKSYNDNPDNILPISMFAQVGYYLVLTKKFAITPTLIYKANENLFQQLDANLKVFYALSKTQNYWFAASYRYGLNKTSQPLNIQLAVGMRQGRLYYAYLYDSQFNEIAVKTWGSHEIMIGIHLGSSKKAVPCPAYKQR